MGIPLGEIVTINAVFTSIHHYSHSTNYIPRATYSTQNQGCFFLMKLTCILSYTSPFNFYKSPGKNTLKSIFKSTFFF